MNIDEDYVKSYPKHNYEKMKKTFIKQVKSTILTSLDGKVSMPVGMNFTNKLVNGQEMANLVKNQN